MDAPYRKIGGEDKTLQTDRRNTQGVPTVVQKPHVTNTGPKLTSFGPKTLRNSRGAPTDLLDF